MPPLPVLLTALARWFPATASGEDLHRRALAASWAGDHTAARQWFAAAATRYRRDLHIEALARLRVHELMTAARGGDGPAPALVEIVRRLNRLDRLESLAPPFALADAREVLAGWMEETGAAKRRVGPADDEEPAPPEARAA